MLTRQSLCAGARKPQCAGPQEQGGPRSARVDVNTRLDDVNHQMEVLRKDIIDAVKRRTRRSPRAFGCETGGTTQGAGGQYQARTEQLSAKFTQFNQALAGFRESLSSLGDRIAQEEQASKALATKVEADTKASTAHINETTRSMSGH